MTARAERSSGPSRGPLSRPINVKAIPDSGLDRSFDASVEECAAIAAATELPRVVSLSARFHVAPRAGGVFEVTGDIAAVITQICVVTLDPFDSVIEQKVSLAFAPVPGSQTEWRNVGSARRGRPAPARPTPPLVIKVGEAEDGPDPIIDDTIDLGAIAVEFLTLARDPYPRKPDVHFDDMVVGEKEPDASAFAALKQLKDRL